MSSATLESFKQQPNDTLAINIPTPPESPQSNSVLSESTLISISTTFCPGVQKHALSSDVVLLSSDSVFFYVHSDVLISVSQNNFNSLLPVDSGVPPDNEVIIPVSESGDVLNIVLHIIYDLEFSHYSHTFPILSAAVSSLKVYGVEPQAYICPSSPLFTSLLSLAPEFPLEVYTLAAHHSLHELAVSASAHLLSYPLHSLSDEAVQAIGPLYLKRLFFLHLGRTDALKCILFHPPHPHAPTHDCDIAAQKELTRAWALASAYLAWEARPDMPASTLESTLAPLCEYLCCGQCRKVLQEHMRSVSVQWSIIKRTI